jgi:hypothetical protein
MSLCLSHWSCCLQDGAQARLVEGELAHADNIAAWLAKLAL